MQITHLFVELHAEDVGLVSHPEDDANGGVDKLLFDLVL
jgi:hypothetical protein